MFRTYRDHFLLVLILLAAVVMYSPVIGYPFTNWDDDIHVTNNPSIHQLSWSSVAELFRPTDRYMYHPLTMVSYMLEWHVAGPDPSLFHTTNLLLHCLNIIALFFLFRTLRANAALALFAVALFALHPLQVESVAWISARKDLLSVFFLLISLLLFVRRRENSFMMLLPSLLAFIAALLSKPSAVVLPGVIMLLQRALEKEWRRESFVPIIPFAVIAGFYTIFIANTVTSPSAAPMTLYPLWERIVLTVYAAVSYPLQFLVPIGLSANYAYPALTEAPLPMRYSVTAMAGILAALGAVLFRKKNPEILFGAAVYVILIAPTLQLIPFHNAALTADRYVYVGLVGLSIALFGIVHRVFVSVGAGTGLFRFVLLLIVTMHIVWTVERIPVWKGSVELFSDVLRNDPENVIAFGNRANARIAAGDYTGAIEDCDRMLARLPRNAKAHYNRALAHGQLGQWNASIADFSAAEEFGFRSANLYLQRGWSYRQAGKGDKATDDFSTALRIDPLSAEAIVMLDSLRREGHPSPEFTAAVRRYLESDPHHPAIRTISAAVAFEAGEVGRAADELARAFAHQPEQEKDIALALRIDRRIAEISDSIDYLSKQLINAPPDQRTSIRRVRSILYRAAGDTLRAELDERK